MAEMGLTRKEVRRLEKQRLISSRWRLEFCMDSWCLIVVTTENGNIIIIIIIIISGL